jgi:hypothetical protein
MTSLRSNYRSLRALAGLNSDVITGGKDLASADRSDFDESAEEIRMIVLSGGRS